MYLILSNLGQGQNWQRYSTCKQDSKKNFHSPQSWWVPQLTEVTEKARLQQQPKVGAEKCVGGREYRQRRFLKALAAAVYVATIFGNTSDPKLWYVNQVVFYVVNKAVSQI